MIDQATVDRIFSAAQINEVVADYVSLKKRGVNYIGCCPFHNEKTPSFTVSPAKGICKCFGCGKGGNSVNFIMEIEQLSYYEALKYLAKKYHIEVIEKEVSSEERQRQSDRDSMLIASEFAQEYFARTLKDTQDGQAIGMSYFRERGFRDDIIERFGLGYCRDMREGFTKAALEKGYKIEYLEKTGLTIVKEEYQVDRFRGRVMFPIYNVAGRVIGFGGRVLKDDKKSAKYLNSPDSEIYSKTFTLYGISHAKRSIVQEDRCYLVEGYTDVLSFHQSGIENTVASSGTALTIEQIRLIKRFTPNITIIYDGDQAGIKASFRGINMILEEGMNLKVLSLPEGDDPDSFARGKSATELREHITQYQTDFIRFKTEILLKQAGEDPILRAELINDIVDNISVIPDPVVQSVYVQECSTLLKIGETVLFEALRKKQGQKIVKAYSPSTQVRQQMSASNPTGLPKEDSVVSHERDIVRQLILHGKKELARQEIDGYTQITTVADYINTEIVAGEMNLTNTLFAQMLSMYLAQDESLTQTQIEDYFINSAEKEVADFAVTLFSKEESHYLHRIWTKNDTYVTKETDILHEIVPAIVTSYKERRINAVITEITKSLNAEMSAEQCTAVMERLREMNLYKTTLSKSLKNRGVM